MNSTMLLAIRVGPASRGPTRVAVDLAQRIGARIVVLVVANELHPIDLTGAPGLTLDEQQEGLVEEAGSTLREFMATHMQGVDASARVESGAVADVVARVATEIGAHYIVVGTRGRGTLARLILGDTTQAILQHAPCPVVVVPIKDEPDDGDA